MLQQSCQPSSERSNPEFAHCSFPFETQILWLAKKPHNEAIMFNTFTILVKHLSIQRRLVLRTKYSCVGWCFDLIVMLHKGEKITEVITIHPEGDRPTLPPLDMLILIMMMYKLR